MLRRYPGPGSGESIAALKHGLAGFVVTAITQIYGVEGNGETFAAPPLPVWDGTILPQHVYFLEAASSNTLPVASGSVTIQYISNGPQGAYHFAVVYGSGSVTPDGFFNFLHGMDLTITGSASQLSIVQDTTVQGTLQLNDALGVAVNLPATHMVVALGEAGIPGVVTSEPASFEDFSYNSGVFETPTLLSGVLFGNKATLTQPYGWSDSGPLTAIHVAGLWRIIATDGRSD